MAYDEELAMRIKTNLKPLSQDITEKKMFGGLSYLYKGKMSIGIIKDELAVRVVSKKFNEVLKQPNVKPMMFTGKPMKNFVYVEPNGFETEEQLTYWVNLGLEHAKEKLKNR
ncbi:MAG: hypothetical protein COA57_10700 [Flavobacteriales bacterium]|nr:MAG: hypothetical protein COA57_10700 [Flavobacteriales bacterium]